MQPVVFVLGPYDEHRVMHHAVTELFESLTPPHFAEVLLVEDLNLTRVQGWGLHDDYRDPACQQVCIKLSAWYIWDAVNSDDSGRFVPPHAGRAPT